MDPIQDKNNIGVFSTFFSMLGIEDVKSKILLSITFVVVVLSAVFAFFLLPPTSFPSNKIITISTGTSLRNASELLAKENIIRSRTLFEFCAKVVGGEKPVVAGDYLFLKPITSCAVASRIARGDSGVPQLRVTIPEGMSNVEIAGVLMKSVPGFDRNAFFENWSSKEGFLFPDTYYFFPNVTTQAIGEKMLATFSRRIEPLESEITSSGHTLQEIVIMASILEKEAATPEDRATISGILWNRIAKGMPLQVDATFMYLLGKTSSELTTADLQFKSAYNTYINKGLPYGPIGNPGIDAIRAAIHPRQSQYLYYLSGKDGVMHYAKTFAEHKANKLKYLK